MKKLSIIIPAYNEEKTLDAIVQKVQEVNISGIKKEILIVNDASKDNSKLVIKKLMAKYSNIKYFEHKVNSGKGAAIRTAIRNITGDFVVIQDGDLEYNPQDFKRLLKPILEGKADVVYGSRIMGSITGFKIPLHYYGNIFLSYMTSILYGKRITDMETCYKMMKRHVAKSLNLKSNRFNIEPEITAKILKKRFKIIEIPINYKARSFREGKKINWKDGISAVFTLIKYALFN